MRQLKIPAAFVRGGTSNGIAFLRENLPPDREDWKEILMPYHYGKKMKSKKKKGSKKKR